MAFLDKYTGDNDYRREARAGKAAKEAAAQESKANAELAAAQQRAVEQQAAAAAKAQEMATDAAFAESMSNLTFSGEPDEVVSDFEIIYQYWLNGGSGEGKLKKSQIKIVNDKLELGFMALKKADSMKADFYEKKIKSEKKKRLIKKIAIAVGVVIALIVCIGVLNQ